jgi:hypothetical protein
VWVCGCVYKIENFRTLSASLREAISSSAAFEIFLLPCCFVYFMGKVA